MLAHALLPVSAPALAHRPTSPSRVLIVEDDLGAGYSTLNYFAELRPEVAKLDMTLVRDVHRTPSKAVLIDALKGACDALGIMVIAERVETAEELAALARRGCDLFQGYLFARPAPAFPAPSWPRHADGAAGAVAGGGIPVRRSRPDG